VLVEVDGAQHTEGTIHGMDAEERMLRDQQKDAAALRGGFHVVRLHVYDTPWWQQVVRGAMVESRLGP
jgi:very-short-patch-repair endonuclease